MVNKRGSNGFTDAAVVILAILLFFRTADVLSYFAPPLLNEMIGSNVSWAYAAVMAFFVEGVAIAFHFDPRAHGHTPAVIVKWTLLAISAACQVFDGRIVTNTLSEMSGPMKVAFEWGVPLLPIFVVVLLFFVGKLPETEGDGRSWLDRLQDDGIKSRLPSPKAIWTGREKARENTEFSPAQAGLTVKMSEIEFVPDEPEEPEVIPVNGQKAGVQNPTKRQP